METNSPATGDTGVPGSESDHPQKAPKLPIGWIMLVTLCVIMVISSILLFLLAVMGSLSETPYYNREFVRAETTAWYLFSIGVFIPSVVVPFLPKRPWAYYVDACYVFLMILMCVFCVPAVLALPVPFFWFTPSTRRYFGIPVRSRRTGGQKG